MEIFSLFCYRFFYELGAFYFLVGTCIGSFLNVCIYRIPRKESLLHPPSHCPQCNRFLRAYENIPILSWIFLRGRCRRCQSRISPQYILIELITGILFLLIWRITLKQNWSLRNLFPYSFIVSILLIVSVTDLKYFIVPKTVTTTGMIVVILWIFFFPDSHWQESTSYVMSMVFSVLKKNHLIESIGFIHSPRGYAILRMLLGILVGGGTLLLFRIIGKYFWGIHTLTYSLPISVTIGDRGNIQLCDQKKTVIKNPGTLIVEGTLLEIEPLKYDLDKKDSPIRWETSGNNTRLVIARSSLFNAKENIKINARKICIPQEVLGIGDVKIMGILGAFLGPEASLWILCVASSAGTFVGLGSIITQKILQKEGQLIQHIPFAPFLSISGIFYMFRAYG